MTDNLEQLEARRAAKFREIATVIAADLGLADFSTLAGAERDRVEKRAELVIDQWEETIELETWPRGPNTRLEALLREYHEICEEILDIRDAKLGGDGIPG